jgi:hypothetical protein
MPWNQFLDDIERRHERQTFFLRHVHRSPEKGPYLRELMIEVPKDD